MSELITDEMVEAAAKARWDHGREDAGDMTEWEMRHPTFREYDTEAMRAALEAVAPLIAAKAWDQGYVASQLEWEHAYDGHIIDPDVSEDMCIECGQGNPYRTSSSEASHD